MQRYAKEEDKDDTNVDNNWSKIRKIIKRGHAISVVATRWTIPEISMKCWTVIQTRRNWEEDFFSVKENARTSRGLHYRN